MAVAPKARAGLVSNRELQGLVDAAVKVAAERTQTPIGDGSTVLKWELIGRILRDLNTAQPFAAEVTRALGAQGVKASPAVLIIDKKILAGFFERLNIPQERQF
jgi:hypothetical protein